MSSERTQKWKKPEIRYLDQPVLEPKAGCAWADTMVLNPAIVKDKISLISTGTGW